MQHRSRSSRCTSSGHLVDIESDDDRPSPDVHSHMLRLHLSEVKSVRVSRFALTLVVLNAVTFFFLFSRFSKSASHLNQQAKHALLPCLSVPVHPLKSFDSFVNDAQQWHQIVQNDVETRFQETVWHTIRGNAVFPSASDMPWRLDQYSSILPRDVRHMHALARYVVRLPSFTEGDHRQHDMHMAYMHFRVDRLRGMQFAAHFYVVERYPQSANSSSDAAHTPSSSVTMYVQRSFECPVCHVAAIVHPKRHDEDDVGSHTVYILLPYHARAHRLQLFVANFLQLRRVLQHHYDVHLVIGVLRHDDHDVHIVNHLRASIASHRDSSIRPHATAIHLSLNDGDATRSFSRAVALRQAAREAVSPDSVLFHCDVDLHITPDFIPRCVMNALPGRQVYFPVLYTLYAHAKRPVVSERNGFWRSSSYGMACIRKRDFETVGAFAGAEQQFRGWGGEDVHHFERVRKSASLVAFRAVDPGLVHLWHVKECKNDVSHEIEYIKFMKTNFMTLGHPFQLGPVLLKTMGTLDRLYGMLQH